MITCPQLTVAAPATDPTPVAANIPTTPTAAIQRRGTKERLAADMLSIKAIPLRVV
jgi:hypothetical protein